MTPFEGTNRVSSPFGPRKNPLSGRWEQHAGQDIVTGAPAWPHENWRVRECTGGTVLRVSSDRWRGTYVDVQTAPGVFERYQHLQEVYVQEGQRIAQGTPLGMAGKSGDSTGVHLHFEVRVNGAAASPAPWSDVPNAAGSYAGNSTKDAFAQSPALSRLVLEPVSGGDVAAMTEHARALGLHYTVETSSMTQE